jgi:energy-coupling factor transport system ATP-binding protein
MPTGNAEVLGCRDVVFRYPGGAKDITSNLSFKTIGGDVVWCVGDNGTGKTTLALLIAGALRPISGRVTIGGLAPSDVSIKQRTRLAFVVQQRTFLGFVKATLGKELSFAARQANLRGLSVTLEEAIRSCGLVGLEKNNPLDLSYTQAWRSALAIGFIINPAVLFVDELPNISSKLVMEAVHYVLARRCKENKVTLISAHESPPSNLPVTQVLELSP